MSSATSESTSHPRVFFDGSDAERPDAVAEEIPQEHYGSRAELRDQVVHCRADQQAHDGGIDEKARSGQQPELRRGRSMRPIAAEREAVVEEIIDARARERGLALPLDRGQSYLKWDSHCETA